MRRLVALLVVLIPAASMANGWGTVATYPFSRSGIGSSNLCDTTIGCPTMGVWFDNAVGATYVSEIGGYTFSVEGNPTRVNGPTWPAGYSGSPGLAWLFDGTLDRLQIADAAAFEVQDFSVFMCFTPKVIANNDVFISKWVGPDANQRSWQVISTDGTAIGLAVSDDGTSGNSTTNAKAAAIAANRMSCATFTYDYVDDGHSVMNTWVDGLTVQTTSTAHGPPFTGTAALGIAAQYGGSASAIVEFYVVAYYPGVLTAADHLKLMRRWRGVYSQSASNFVTFTSAAPPAFQVAAPDDDVEPFFFDMPANTGMIGRSASCYGIYGAASVTNLCQRSSFETSALTGWTEAPTSTGDCAQSVTRMVHGQGSMSCSTADADDAITATGACLTVVGATEYRLGAWAVLISGTGLLDINLIEDDSADCATPTTTTAVVDNQVPAAEWTYYSGLITTQAGTIRAQVQISLPAAAAQVVDVDAVTLRAGGPANDTYCDSPADASGVCTTVIPSIASRMSINGSQTIEATACSPWAGTDITAYRYVWSDGNGGAANTLRHGVSEASDEPRFDVIDPAGDAKYNLPNLANWAANTVYTLFGYMSGLGDVREKWPVGTWTKATGGTGLGTRNAGQTTTYLGCSHNACGDVWVYGFTIYRRLL